MNKIILFPLLMMGIGQAALASHPHDRVCVVSGPAYIDFVFQYSIARVYESGSANQDPRKIAAEAAYSVGDYMDLPAEKFKSEARIINPQTTLDIPMTLKSSKGEILFDGVLDLRNEQLNGTFTGGVEKKSVKGNVKMSCVSQPRLTLESDDQDIAAPI